MITLTAASGTGFFNTTPGAEGVIATTGPYNHKTKIKVSYCLSGNTGVFAGVDDLFGPNFHLPIRFPGSQLKFELIDPDAADAINIEVSPT